MANTIEQLERRIMQAQVTKEQQEKEIAEIEKTLEAEGITRDTDVDAFLADLQAKEEAAEEEYEKMYMALTDELDKAQEVLN